MSSKSERLILYTPEQYGFGPSPRNYDIFHALSLKQNAYIYNDKEAKDITPVINTFVNNIGMAICQINLQPQTNQQEILLSTGIKIEANRFRTDEWKQKESYLVLRGLDRFVLSHQDEYFSNSPLEQTFQVLYLAQKNSKGSMVTHEGERKDWREIYGKTNSNTYWMRSFLLSFIPIYVIVE